MELHVESVYNESIWSAKLNRSTYTPNVSCFFTYGCTNKVQHIRYSWQPLLKRQGKSQATTIRLLRAVQDHMTTTSFGSEKKYIHIVKTHIRETRVSRHNGGPLKCPPYTSQYGSALIAQGVSGGWHTLLPSDAIVSRTDIVSWQFSAVWFWTSVKK